LNKFDPETDSFTALTERQGLPNNFIYCIIPDEQGNLWLTTNFGLSRFDPRTEIFENYTTSDGLQSNEFNSGACARSANGNIYVGGTLGINLFNPSKIRASSYIPPIALTSLTQNEKTVQITISVESIQEVVLKWPKNSFEFEFTSLSFADPQKNQYAYMLEGLDTNWNDIGNKHEGRYTNLPGGEYNLRLKGSNNDGVWNETGATIKITVIPPFWQTWWFYTFAGLMAIVSIWGGYRLRIHGIESHRHELEREVQERTREIERLFEQTKELAIIEERNRLARDLHDSAKQKAFAALAQIGTAGGIIQNNPKAAHEHLNEAENLVYDVIQELTFLIQEMYPLALKEKGLATSIREYLYEWENRTDIPVNAQIKGEQRLPLKMEQAIYRISQESLANVARHSHATRVEVIMDYGKDAICLSISDNGRGFDPKQKPNGIGLRSIRERAESIGGQVTIESTIGKGTCVNVTIPGKAVSGE
jgi:signal transduction histidine kinase